MDIKKRVWAVLLSLMLLVTLTDVTTFAANTTGGAVLSISAAGIDPVVDVKLKDYRSILITGIDNEGRADLIIVFSYNQKTNQAKVFTVARDTYMQLNNSKIYTVHGKQREFCKCNQAADYGGMNTLIKALNRHLDLNIREYVAIDWECAAALIDEFGGLYVKVDSKMLPWINEDTILKSYGNVNYKIKSPGPQTLNGWQAVQYLRVRNYSGGNARVRDDRNKEVFVQLFNKAKSSMSLTEINRIYNVVSGKIDTNMDIVSVLGLIKSLSLSSSKRFPYNFKTYYDPDGFYAYSVMNTNASNVKNLHKTVFGQKNYKLSSTANSLSKKTQKLTKSYLKKKMPTLSSSSVTVSGATYTGAPFTPDVSVQLGDRTLIEGTDYVNDSLSAKTKVGSYSFTVKGIGAAYGGQSKKVTYTIIPKGSTGLTLEPIAKGFTASWNQQAETMPDIHITGYQIQYGLKSNFKSAKTTKVSGYEKQTATIKKLKGRKTYYVRMRTYVTIGKKTYYSNWSDTITVKTK